MKANVYQEPTYKVELITIGSVGISWYKYTREGHDKSVCPSPCPKELYHHSFIQTLSTGFLNTISMVNKNPKKYEKFNKMLFMKSELVLRPEEFQNVIIEIYY